MADGVHFVPRDGSGGTMQPVDVSACETIADALPWVDTPQSIGPAPSASCEGDASQLGMKDLPFG